MDPVVLWAAHYDYPIEAPGEEALLDPDLLRALYRLGPPLQNWCAAGSWSWRVSSRRGGLSRGVAPDGMGSEDGTADAGSRTLSWHSGLAEQPGRRRTPECGRLPGRTWKRMAQQPARR